MKKLRNLLNSINEARKTALHAGVPWRFGWLFVERILNLHITIRPRGIAEEENSFQKYKLAVAEEQQGEDDK